MSRSRTDYISEPVEILFLATLTLIVTLCKNELKLGATVVFQSNLWYTLPFFICKQQCVFLIIMEKVPRLVVCAKVCSVWLFYEENCEWLYCGLWFHPIWTNTLQSLRTWICIWFVEAENCCLLISEERIRKLFHLIWVY